MTPALTITMTNAGLARFTAAQLGDGIDLAISTIALTDADFVVAPTLEALPGEFRRIDTISGKSVGNNVIHLTMRDDARIGYVYGAFVITGIDDRAKAFFPDGTPRQIDFAIDLLRVDSDVA
jgi:hypothetical protein